MDLKGFSSPEWSKISLPDHTNKQKSRQVSPGATAVCTTDQRDLADKSLPANIGSIVRLYLLFGL